MRCRRDPRVSLHSCDTPAPPGHQLEQSSLLLQAGVACHSELQRGGATALAGHRHAAEHGWRRRPGREIQQVREGRREFQDEGFWEGRQDVKGCVGVGRQVGSDAHRGGVVCGAGAGRCPPRFVQGRSAPQPEDPPKEEKPRLQEGGQDQQGQGECERALLLARVGVCWGGGGRAAP